MAIRGTWKSCWAKTFPSDCIVKHPLLNRESERGWLRSNDHRTPVDFRKSRCYLHAWERLKSLTRQRRDEEHNISDATVRSQCIRNGTHTQPSKCTENDVSFCMPVLNAVGREITSQVKFILHWNSQTYTSCRQIKRTLNEVEKKTGLMCVNVKVIYFCKK